MKKIVIDIPDEKYDRIMRQMALDRNFSECKITPLPKGHGDLIDINELEKEKTTFTTDDFSGNEMLEGVLWEDIENASTIIEADKGEEE